MAAFARGQRLGPYEILGLLGEGGMGAVYRATDTKLHRDVAIKILPPAFAEDAERMQRFEREAQVLASLNHPNIAAIYGVEQGAIVMELVEGENLKGPVPVDTAVDYARQIAAGLEAAHEKGVVHRDLKPANIRVTPDGVVKLLDFGLAKASEAEVSAAGASPTMSPTLSLEMTQAGMILGTAAYMSPEQARGKAVDRRADIWAFGAVLYEMLAGQAPFASGETLPDTIAAVMTREPDWNALPKDTPPHVRRLLQRCLRKDAKNRLRDIGDARIALEEGGDDAPEGASQTPPNQLRRALPWALAAAAAVIAGWTLWHAAGARREVMHVDITYPPNVEPVWRMQAGFAVSPDGRSFAMMGVRDGVRRLYVYRLDRAEAAEIDGTAGVNSAEFSPDGAGIVFVAMSGSVTRLSLADRQRAVVAAVADVTSPFAWGSGELVYGRGGALWTVPAKGGTPRQLTKLDPTRHEVLHIDPAVFPGTRTALFTSLTNEAGAERIEAASLDGGRRSVVIEHAMAPVWSPTGHLLFGRDGAVWAVPFDPESASVRGAAVPVIPAGVVGTLISGSLGFRVSSTGTLVYEPADFDYKRVVSVARDGSELALNLLPPNRYGNPRISPDGRRLLVETDLSFIETLDLARGVRTTLTAAALGTSYSAWTADGKGVVFRRYNSPFWTAADGRGQAGARAVRDVQRLSDIGGTRCRFHSRRAHSGGNDGRHFPYVHQRKVPAQAVARNAGVRRGRATVARRVLDGLPVERVRPAGDLRSPVPRPGPRVAGFGGRWRAGAVEQHGPGDLLSWKPTYDGGHVRRLENRTDIRKTNGPIRGRIRLRAEHLDRELRRDSRRAVHYAAAGHPRRPFTRGD
jgi:serine/threonine-protein kinase